MDRTGCPICSGVPDNVVPWQEFFRWRHVTFSFTFSYDVISLLFASWYLVMCLDQYFVLTLFLIGVVVVAVVGAGEHEGTRKAFDTHYLSSLGLLLSFLNIYFI